MAVTEELTQIQKRRGRRSMAYLYNHLDLEKDEGLGEIQALIG